MSIRFDCIGCNKKIVVHDRFEGRNVRCPTCGFEISVPKKLKLGDEKRRPAEENFVEALVDSSKADAETENSIPSTENQEVETIGDPVEEAATALAKPTKHHRRSIQKEHGDKEEDLEWDITPMVDVAFLLLIFFMLTASFSIQKVIRTNVPQSDEPSRNAVQIQPDERIERLLVQIDEFNAYTVVLADGQRNDASSKQELITILKEFRIHAGEPLPRVVIQAHVDSFHGATVGCMDASREAGFSEFQLLAVESFD
jgi:biopolymer transport protein ExbD/DNA-directed RNA polymerase subunit RPC12/RpoP